MSTFTAAELRALNLSDKAEDTLVDESESRRRLLENLARAESRQDQGATILGLRIRAACVIRGKISAAKKEVPNKRLANELGCSPLSLKHLWAAEKPTCPTYDELERIARGLNVDLWWLLTGLPVPEWLVPAMENMPDEVPKGREHLIILSEAELTMLHLTLCGLDHSDRQLWKTEYMAKNINAIKYKLCESLMRERMVMPADPSRGRKKKARAIRKSSN